jgi:enoyl-CoA hydratase/carnithine racemase
MRAAGGPRIRVGQRADAPEEKSMTEHVRSEKSNGILTLTLNRPEKKNALTRAMYQALGEAIDGAERDPDVRCVLIQSEGDLFTAGNDLGDFAAVSNGQAQDAGRPGENPLLVALARAKTPLVAAVQGKAVGVGVTMLLHCDLVFLADDAQLTTPFVNLALVPEAASSLLLPARIGHARAFSMFVLGEAVDAQKAVAWGIANAVVPRAELRARARAAAEAVAQRPPAAVAITKALMRDPEALKERLDVEGEHFVAQLSSPEAREAFAAFAQKRAPDFSKVR